MSDKPEDKTKESLLSALIPDEIEDVLGLHREDETEEAGDANQSLLRAMGGKADDPLGKAFAEFLGGKGDLLETTRLALTRGKKTADEEIAVFLSDRFGLNKTAARVAAKLLIQVFPGIKKLAGTTEKPAAKPKKKKPAAKKKPASSTAAKDKKKPAAKKKTEKKTTPKKPAAKKPAAKKKTTAKKK